MSVRQSLLAILCQGPCYGYQLRAEFDRRTGSVWPLNVGQIYNTLERLERDGLVAKGDPDDQGHVYYSATDAGRAEAAAWLERPVVRAASGRDELTVKVALAATLPGVDAPALIAAERAAAEVRLEALRDAAPADAAGPDGLARVLVHDGLLATAEAELAWLDRTAARIADLPAAARTAGLSELRPKRGRPARVA